MRLPLLASVLLLFQAPAAFAQGGSESGDLNASLTGILQELRAHYRLPALAAALVGPDRLLAAGAVGVRVVNTPDPVTVNSRFHVGSVSKPISATVIATLVEHGELSWDTRVVDIFPELRDSVLPPYRAVTLEHLLSHRAGILPWEEDTEIAKGPRLRGTPTEQRRGLTSWLLRQPPIGSPGADHVYSNAGYAIAAAMAERVARLSWEELVTKRLAEPLGLETVGFGWPARADPKAPWGHRANRGTFKPHPPDDKYQLGPLLGPAGDLHMSILDLASFAQLHLRGLLGEPTTLLRAETVRRLHTPLAADYGLGWNTREAGDHHLGGAETFLTAIFVAPKRRIAIVVATNADAEVALVSAVINRSLRMLGV